MGDCLSKKGLTVGVIVLFLSISVIPVISAIETQEPSNNDFHASQKSTPTYHFVPIKIRGTGYLYSTLYYLSIIPMIIIDLIMLGLEILGICGDLTILIWNIFHNYIPDFIRDISDLRDRVFPIFFMCPFINVIQSGGGYQIGDDDGVCFHGTLHGFTGIALEYSNNRIFIKGFAIRVDI